ncbi:MAG: tpl protein [Eggerthellaceae bacterium]|nr:tpl protein [Eggerthellaceae bacterium]
MPKVAPVRLAFSTKTLWFNPNDVQYSVGDSLIVHTERGLEMGKSEGLPFDVDQERIDELPSPLQPVERVATQEDMQQHERMQQAADEAYPIFKEIVGEMHLEMRPVSVEYLFDGQKAVFYFEADDRVDFRDLIRELSSRFHVRIDMRQIGARDKARMIGGLGHCGQEICCARFGEGFEPVSIRMAKDQDLSLNPSKISGICGRLMCCLRYETDTYKDFKATCPKVGAMLATPEGEARVTEVHVLRECVVVSDDEGSKISIPAEKLTCERNEYGNGRPDTIPDDVYYEAQEAQEADRATILIFDTELTGEDRVATPDTFVKNSHFKEEVPQTRRKRRRTTSGNSSEAENEIVETSSYSSAKDTRKPRQRRNRNEKIQRNEQQGAHTFNQTRRPGQKSSGLSNMPQSTASEREQAPTPPDRRRKRRRSHSASGDKGEQQYRINYDLYTRTWKRSIALLIID